MTKIVCTIGPSSSSRERLRKLMMAGMSIARLNFSHGSEEEYVEVIRLIKEVRRELGVHVAIALDTMGPETRITVQNSIHVRENDVLVFSVVPRPGVVLVTPIDLTRLKAGDKVFVDDGILGMEVTEVQDDTFTCRCLNRHVIENRKSINFPGVQLGLEPLSSRDKSDIMFGLKNGVDFIFASFINSAADVRAIRDLAGNDVLIVSKIETLNAMKSLEEIADASDGVMAARGDLGVEIGLENLFEAQKLIFRLCRERGKPLICATEMMQSMTSKPVPSRSEISDVGNAVLDGCDCVMLSAETATGQFPVETVSFARRICANAERYLGASGLHVILYARSYADILRTASRRIVVSEDERLLRKTCIHRGVLPVSASTSVDLPSIKTRLGVSDVLVSESFLEYLGGKA
jgi:pyruvate kinase